MMSANPISEKLLRAREERSIPIEQVNEKTKIRLHVLAALESGEFDKLDPVYIKSYIKEYASAIKLSQPETEAILKEYSELFEKKETGIFSLGAPEPKRIKLTSPVDLRKGGFLATKRGRIILASILGALLIAGGAVYALFFMPVSKQPQQSSTQPLDISTNNSQNNNSKGSEGLISMMNEGQQDSILLEATATDTSWISIVIDGLRSEQFILPPGQPKSWYAGKQFVLSVGNAGAVTLRRNGQQLPVLGKKGAIVRSIKITVDDFQTSALPWNPNSPSSKKKSDQPARPRPDITPVPPA